MIDVLLWIGMTALVVIAFWGERKLQQKYPHCRSCGRPF